MPAFNWLAPLDSCCTSRAFAFAAGASLVALDVSVVLLVVDLEGCAEAAAYGFPEAKPPLLFNDSAARESDVTRPVASWMGWFERGSVVTYVYQIGGRQRWCRNSCVWDETFSYAMLRKSKGSWENAHLLSVSGWSSHCENQLSDLSNENSF